MLLSRSTSPRWLDPRQTSLTVVPRQLFLTVGQKRGCRLQRQRWCQQQGGGRRQRQWWQLGLRHKWWFKIFQLLQIAASLECLTCSFWKKMTATFSKKSFASLRVPPVFIYVSITRHFKLACVVVVFLFRTKDICYCSCAWLLGDGWWGWRRCGLDGRQSFTGVRAIPPNGFIVKDSQMGTLHIFPRTLICRSDIYGLGGNLSNNGSEQPESREWCGYVLGNYVWAPGDGAWAPRSIMNSSALVSVAESVLGTAGVQTRRRVAIEPELYTTTTTAAPDPLLASSDWC